MATNVVLLSGGIDSATLVASLVEQGAPVRGLFVDHGQAAAENETASAKAVAEHYDIHLDAITVGGLAFGQGEIRGRNAFLLHTGLLAVAPGATVLLMGIHGGTTYVDCSEPFLQIERRSFDLHTGGEVQIAAPFLGMTKGDVLQVARDLGVPLDSTYSCECGGEPCGACLSCLDRAHLGAFA
jgi:7-cyano-7-deazaguanine synthase